MCQNYYAQMSNTGLHTFVPILCFFLSKIKNYERKGCIFSPLNVFLDEVLKVYLSGKSRFSKHFKGSWWKTHNGCKSILKLNLVSEAYEREDVPLCKIRWMTKKSIISTKRSLMKRLRTTDWETPNGSPIINNWWSNQGEDHSKIAFRKIIWKDPKKQQLKW